jgi:excinuclease UvrABC nuclease subunit
MKKFKFLPPYKGQGKTNFPATQNRSGVYIIKENNKIVYIGMSGTNLYKTLYRHFETWVHKLQEVVTYKTRLSKHKYSVRVILCTPLQAARLERLLILKYNPRDNDLKYKGYQLSAIDQRILVMYENEPINQEAPF